MIGNNLAEYRQKRGLTAAQLASQVGVTRQTIYSIEAGSYVPNTVVALRLGRTLGATVEELFPIADEAPFQYRAEAAVLLPVVQESSDGQPVQLCRVGGHLIAVCPESMAWSLPPADGVLVDVPRKGKTKPGVQVQPFRDPKDLNKRLLVAGCDPGISVLSRHLQRAGIELVVVNRNSTEALNLLKEGLVHVAGIHLRDETTGESNLPAVMRHFDKRSVAVIGFAIWEEGILTARGNPKKIRTLDDFARRGVVMVNREPGAAVRIMLDSYLAKTGIDPRGLRGYDQIAHGHLPCALQVRCGKADCCIATRAAACVFGLDFVSLVKERYDLVMRKTTLNLPEMQELLDTLGRTAFRLELEGLGGYDTSTAGKQFA